MSYRYLYTAGGRPAASLVGDNHFDFEGPWLGLQDEEGNIWDPEGYFLGVTTDEDRLVRLSQPKGPPFFLSPRPSPSPPEDLVPPGPREPVTIPTDLIDALEGLGYTTLGQAHLASLGTLKDCGLGIYSAGTWVSQCS